MDYEQYFEKITLDVLFMGAGIFLGALRQFFQNWRIVLRLSLFWVIFCTAIYWWQYSTFNESSFDVAATFSLKTFVISLLSGIFILVGVMSMAIGWHRYMLLDETPARLHIINFKWPVLSYFLHILKLALVSFLIMIPLMVIVMPIITSQFAGVTHVESLAAYTVLFLVPFVLVLFMTWIGLRLGLVLPAAAIGLDLRLRRSFALTRPASFQLLITALLIVSFNTVSSYIAAASTAITPLGTSSVGPFSLVLIGLLNWLGFFIGIAVLTNAFSLLYKERRAE
ncbi:MAG: hypothetical protein ABJM29_04995 [Rhizobiaceae bacterium]